MPRRSFREWISNFRVWKKQRRTRQPPPAPVPSRPACWERLLELSSQKKPSPEILRFWHAQWEAGERIPVEDKIVQRAVLHARNAVLRDAWFIVTGPGVREKDGSTLQNALLGFCPQSQEWRAAEKVFARLQASRKPRSYARYLHAYAQILVLQRERLREEMMQNEIRPSPHSKTQ